MQKRAVLTEHEKNIQQVQLSNPNHRNSVTGKMLVQQQVQKMNCLQNIELRNHYGFFFSMKRQCRFQGTMVTAPNWLIWRYSMLTHKKV